MRWRSWTRSVTPICGPVIQPRSGWPTVRASPPASLVNGCRWRTSSRRSSPRRTQRCRQVESASTPRVLSDAVNERNQAELAPLIEDLIAASHGTVFTKWRANVTALARALDADGPHDPAADLARNRMTLSPTDGFIMFRGELSGEHALTVHDTLNTIADELFGQYSRSRTTCPELEIPRQGHTVGVGPRRTVQARSRGRQALDVAATRRSHRHHPTRRDQRRRSLP